MSYNHKLVAAKLNQQSLTEFGYANDPTARVKGTFPFSAASGNKNTAVVYVEIEPGRKLPTHTDSAEELVLILAGTAEVTVEQERGRVAAGEMALIPSMAPHSVCNVGNETVRMLGFFSSNTVMSTFDQPLLPIGQAPMSPLGERTFLAPLPVILEQVATAAMAIEA